MIRSPRFFLSVALTLAVLAGLCTPAAALERTSFIAQQGGIGFLGLSLTPLHFEAQRAAPATPITILGFRLSPALRFDARSGSLAEQVFGTGENALSFHGASAFTQTDGPDIGLDLSDTLSMHGGYRRTDAGDLGMADMGFDYQGHELRVGFSYKLK